MPHRPVESRLPKVSSVAYQIAGYVAALSLYERNRESDWHSGFRWGVAATVGGLALFFIVAAAVLK